ATWDRIISGGKIYTAPLTKRQSDDLSAGAEGAYFDSAYTPPVKVATFTYNSAKTYCESIGGAIPTVAEFAALYTDAAPKTKDWPVELAYWADNSGHSTTYSLFSGEISESPLEMTYVSCLIEAKDELVTHDTISASQDSFPITVSPQLLAPHEIVLIDNELIPKPNNIQFSDVSISFNSTHWELINNTPMRIKSIVVKDDDKGGYIYFTFNNEIQEYNKVTFDYNNFDYKASNKFHIINQSNLFNPYIKFKDTESSDCPEEVNEEVDKQCFNVVNEQQRHVYEVHYSRLRQIWNSLSWYQFMMRFYDENCGDYTECDEYSGTLLYSSLRFLQMAMNGWTLKPYVLEGVYESEGRASLLGAPNIGNKTQYEKDEMSGRVGIRWEIITEGARRDVPFDPHTFDVIFHETAHVYGQTHDSGMTYGLGEAYGHQYLPNLYTEDELSSLPVFRASPVVIDTEVIGEGEVLIHFFTTELDTEPLSMTILSDGLITAKTAYKKNGATAKISIPIKYDTSGKFINQPPIYLRINNNSNDQVSTSIIDVKKTISSDSVLIDNEEYIFPKKSLYSDESNGWDVIHVCEEFNATLATKAQYQLLYDKIMDEGELSDMKIKTFWTIDQPKSYYIWEVLFSIDGIDSKEISKSAFIGKDKGIVCVKPNENDE
ncbi:hypothetical protein CGI23_25390, partial [Vibrio parahaemolyticus]|uniref:hypothetical protein n=1 Tax=Vibrio parahaemolyticus TaxID=670 RepID=UPI00117473FD